MALNPMNGHALSDRIGSEEASSESSKYHHLLLLNLSCHLLETLLEDEIGRASF